MRTTRWFPGCAEHRYFYHCLERFFLSKKVESLGTAILVQILAAMLRKARLGTLDCSAKRRQMPCIIGCELSFTSLRTEMDKKRIIVFYPSQEMQILDENMPSFVSFIPHDPYQDQCPKPPWLHLDGLTSSTFVFYLFWT